MSDRIDLCLKTLSQEKMTELNLKDIVLNADFSPIYMGQTESEVVTILGPPGDRADQGNGIVLFSYGSYELAFFDNSLHLFQNDHLKVECVYNDNCLYQNSHFAINPWIVSPHQNISMREVISILEQENVEFSIENQKVAGQDYRVGEVKFLALSNGISMNFEHTTTIIKHAVGETILESEDIVFTDEMDFVLYAIRYEHWNVGKHDQTPI